MSLVIFGVGVFVFFLTVYGTVVAGGLQLTKKQIETSPELSPSLDTNPDDPDDGLSTSDIVRADF
ncbi:MAG: hypothetical protein HOJ85_00635 [Ilumatobacter sp.]|jgi:hypothetical protein|uniref:hypothetical protein n=1 Tax=Ilumatobacter sp. TaxID=1967498 RepID=UPI001D378CE7|nr:hypothetical protein [Ilumatobacter sp.]MBT5275232.1 hypothetical protein [Ilumatobacter sp.]MBT5552258.1 hypothetical protein [Ilumatobacter sp.]MBT5864779.1 hypothetical protein [Ilumatobacter sp.]MBT7430577.1 hypothetical protein [Ilumatobacter sp.]